MGKFSGYIILRAVVYCVQVVREVVVRSSEKQGDQCNQYCVYSVSRQSECAVILTLSYILKTIFSVVVSMYSENVTSYW